LLGRSLGGQSKRSVEADTTDQPNDNQAKPVRNDAQLLASEPGPERRSRWQSDACWVTALAAAPAGGRIN